MSEARAVVALDVGGTKTACGLFRQDGTRLFYRVVPTAQTTPEASVEQLAGLAEEAISSCPKDHSACAVGIVVPGWVDRRSRTVWAPNIAGWDHIALESLLAAALPLPIVLDSDRSGYVMGETWLGAARGCRDVVFLAVGTGIGAGIVADGRLIHGRDDLAGAVGWMALNPQFRDDYARMGCFEAEASGNSLGRKAARDWAREGGTVGTAQVLIEAAKAGDASALGLVEEGASYIGMGIANIISTLNPEIVVLGGGLFQSGKWLLDLVQKQAMRWAQPFAAERVRIELSSLGEGAGLCGAARIALDNS